MSHEKLQIGSVLRPHGVRGLLRIRASDALPRLSRLYVRERLYELVRAVPERGDFLVELAGVGTREAADALRGAPLYALRSDLPPLGSDEQYAADLIGCAVYDTKGLYLGEVSGSFPAGPNEILQVRGDHEFMLPWVAPLVSSVDFQARRIVCDPPPGLLDLEKGGGDDD